MVCLDFVVIAKAHKLAATEACALRVLACLGREVRLIIEQPSSSWGLKQEFIQQLKQSCSMFLGCTFTYLVLKCFTMF
jgi:hypothetical protein